MLVLYTLAPMAQLLTRRWCASSPNSLHPFRQFTLLEQVKHIRLVKLPQRHALPIPLRVIHTHKRDSFG